MRDTSYMMLLKQGTCQSVRLGGGAGVKMSHTLCKERQTRRKSGIDSVAERLLGREKKVPITELSDKNVSTTKTYKSVVSACPPGVHLPQRLLAKGRMADNSAPGWPSRRRPIRILIQEVGYSSPRCKPRRYATWPRCWLPSTLSG